MSSLPLDYAELTVRDLLTLYTGPSALPVPDELVEWVVCGRELQEIIDLERELAALERGLA